MTGTLENLFFHVRRAEDRAIDKQGQIRDQLTGEWYTAILFNWIDGGEGDIIVVHLSDMKGWSFYQHEEDWRRKAELDMKQRRPQ